MDEKKRRFINSIRSRFGRTVVLTLVSVFLLLIAIAVVAVSISLGKDMRQSISEKKKEQFHMVESSVNQRLTELSGILYGVVSDEAFYISHGPVEINSGYRMVAALSKYLKGNDFASYLAYYRLADPHKVYSTAGEMDLHTFLQVYLKAGGKEEDFLGMAMDTSKARYYPATFRMENSEYLTIASTLPQFSQTPRAAIMAFVDEDDLQGLIDPLYLDCFGAFSIVSAEGNWIYSYSNVQEKLFDALEEVQYRYPANQGSDVVTIHGEKYMVQQFTNVEFGWTCTALIRLSDIMESANNRQIQLCTIIAVAFLCAGAFLVVFVLRQYSPINQLAQSVKDQIQDAGSSPTAFDEQSLLSSAFAALLEEKNNHYLEMFYTNLLTEQYDAQAAQDAMREYNIHFEYPFFTALVIHTGKAVIPEKQRRAFCMGIEECCSQDDMWCYALYQPNQGRVLVFLNHAGMRITEDEENRITQSLAPYILAECRCVLAMGMGNAFGSAMQWDASYRQASSAMYYCKMEQCSACLRYSSIENNNAISTILSYKVKLLAVCRKGIVTEAEQITCQIREQCAKGVVSAHQLNYLTYDIITSLLELTEDASVTEKLNEMLENLLDKQHVEPAFFDTVSALCLQITGQRKEAKQNQKDELLEKIKACMDTHLCDNTLCLESIADHCEISASYLSRYFKQKMNCTPMSYVDNARMELVKEKLTKTELPLKQILEEVGYIDQSNFIRKFKRIEGMTPSAYRELHRKQT